MCGKKLKRVVDHTLATWDKLAFDLIPVSGHGFYDCTEGKIPIFVFGICLLSEKFLREGFNLQCFLE